MRWLRGALGIALTWGLLRAALGLILGLIISVFRPEKIGPGEGLGKVLPIFEMVGFLSGLGFAGFRLTTGTGRFSLGGTVTVVGLGLASGVLAAVVLAGARALLRRWPPSTTVVFWLCRPPSP